MNELDTGATPMATDHPIVSVVIPTYNRHEWLREAIASVFSQSQDIALEIIVIDDGSTDGTAEALSEVFARPNVKYIWQDNTGKPAAARNRGLREVRGEFIVFLDSDDLLHPESIARRLEVLREYGDVGLVCTDWLCFAGSVAQGTKPSILTAYRFLAGVPADLIERKNGRTYVFHKPFVYELLYSEFVFTSSTMVRRALLDAIGGFDESITIGEDLDLWLRIGLQSKLAYIDEPLSFMRNHATHITSDETRNFREDERVIELFLKRSGSIPRGLRRRIGARLSSFYTAGGKVYMRVKDKPQARRFFFKSLLWNPYSWKNVKNMLKSLR